MNPILKALAALAAVAAMGAAHAGPVTYTFTGTVTYNNGGPSGQSLSGSLTVDPSIITDGSTDGLAFDYRNGYYYNPAYCPGCTPQQSNPLQVVGHTTDGSTQVSVGGGTLYDTAHIGVYRNFTDSNQNAFVVYGASYSTNGSDFIEIYTYDLLGTASQIFTDPNGGLDFTQGIDWSANGSFSLFVAAQYNYQTNSYVAYQSGVLTSVSVAPEPAMISLVGAALLGIAATRRRKPAAPAAGSLSVWQSAGSQRHGLANTTGAMSAVHGNSFRRASSYESWRPIWWGMAPMIMALALLPPVAHSAPVSTSLMPFDAATLMDNFDNGTMSFNAAFGHGTEEWDYAYVDTRLDAAQDVDRFARAGVEFDLSLLRGSVIDSATLAIQPYFSRDLMAPPSGLPQIQVWGYAGTGVVNAPGLLTGRFLTSFSPVLVDGANDRGPEGWAPVTLDVTGFVDEMIRQGEDFAGFRFNIADDLSGQRNLFSEFAFGGLGAAKSAYRPGLIVVSDVPAPATAALVGAALAGVVITRKRKPASPTA